MDGTAEARARRRDGPEIQRGRSVAGPDRRRRGGQVRPLGGGAWGPGSACSGERSWPVLNPEP